MLNVQPQDVATLPDHARGQAVAVEQAEAALVEHYARLVRLAYLVLPPSLGPGRRVLTAHAVTQRALPRGRAADVPDAPAASPSTLRAWEVPPQAARSGAGAGRNGDPGYAYLRLQVLRTALRAGRPFSWRTWPRRAHLPPLLPQVWGLRLFPRSGSAAELALDQRLSALSAPARAAYVLRGLERLTDADVVAVLASAGAADPGAALREADGLEARYELLESSEFDPCSLQARPTDLVRRRHHMKAAAAATAAVLVCVALLAMPGSGWGPDGAAAPPYAQNPAAEAALDPAKLTKVAPTAWKRSARTDFSAWPARGNLAGDRTLLRRALAVWARPGPSVQVSATPGTPAGAPPGPAQLLYAGEVDEARVVLLHDGLRIVRYAEPKNGTSGAALDFARVDGATAQEANAVVVARADGNVRYLTAPWVSATSLRDLLKPDAEPLELGRSPDGVTDPLAGPTRAGACRSWNVLQVQHDASTRLMTDLGELVPAHLTSGRPETPREATGPLSLAGWARTACSLAAVRSHGVRSVNLWQYARQQLPEGNGAATWMCTRAETWRGTGSRVLAHFLEPGQAAGAVAAKAEDSPACGTREPHVLAGVLWKSQSGAWYLLAAGSRQVVSVQATGAVSGSAQGHVLSVRTQQGAQVGLRGQLANGRGISALR
ncbi:hypothetical protein H1V43_02400 [Streptomyces sp. PSKA54]|uniref:Uncharacterized protein n=1 Tax=Streptomyces himalayensis subsp. aureolus TaxID=2758039 RepID=A0A7W2HDY4_9ACTN|nr:hypothetical protein [Streptomyces himalayensis subsp. aureolus]